MANSVDINLEGNILVQLEKLNKSFSVLNTRVESVEKKSESAFSGIRRSMRNISFVQVTQGIENLSNSLSAINAPGLSFEQSMADMSAITGLTGGALEKLGKKARANAKEFGGSAAKSVETYKLLLSQLTPELANKPEILDAMAKNVAILSKTMGGDTTAAANVLTTGMNQYGVSMENPIEAQKEMASQMNIMAGAAKEGSAELPQIQSAIANVGGDAKRAGLEFAEMNSAIQFLDKAGKKGSEGGVALRNTLSTLAQGRFLPKEVQVALKGYQVDLAKLSDTTIPFTDRLRELKKAQHDSALMTKLFGKENALGANALIDSVDAQDAMTEAIENTKTAEQQAAVVMETTIEKRERMKTKIDDVKISMFEATNGAFAYLEPVSKIAQVFSGFVPLVSGSIEVFDALRKSKLAQAAATKIATAAEWLLNAAMNANPVFLIITGVVALSAAVYAASKAFSTMSTSQKNAEKATKRAKEAIIDEQVELSLLFEELRDTNTESDRKKEIITQLNSEYPTLLRNYDLEKGNLEDINNAEKEIVQSLYEKAEAAAFFEIAQEEAKKAVKEGIDGPGFWDHVLSASTDGMVSANDFNKMDVAEYKENSKDALRQGRKIESEIKKKNAEAESALKKQNELKDALSDSGTPEDGEIDPKTGKEIDIKVIAAKNGAGSKKFSSEKNIKSISVNIQNLMSGDIIINKNTMNESMAIIRQKISEALVGVVRDYEVAI